MPKDSLMNFFLQDHKVIEELIKESIFRYNLNSITWEYLHDIKWRMKRHFYLEEKFLYLHPVLKAQLKEKQIKGLKRQHDKILEAWKKIPEEKNQQYKKYLDEFLHLLQIHVQYENDQIYPQIFAQITTEQAQKIKDQLNKEANTGFYPLQTLREKYDKKSK
jgi:hemerythrin-like domain-containing protein